MMLMGKTLLRAGLRFGACPLKYIYPSVNIGKCYCTESHPFDTNYTDAEIAIMKHNFDEEDDDEDRLINMSQFNYFIQRTMGRSLDSRELYCLFAEVDKDGDGYLSFPDIVAHFEKQFQPLDDLRLKQVFCLYDKDEDGKIKLHELREILVHLGFLIACSPRIEGMFEKRDPKKIRKIDYQNFCEFMKEDIRTLMSRT